MRARAPRSPRNLPPTCPHDGRRRVLGALSGVRDPELDEPIAELGFVSDLEIEGEAVKIRLRLPTYFCAPNFAYLMVADTGGHPVGSRRAVG